MNLGGRYFFTRNSSTIVAFVVGPEFSHENSSFRIIGTHTDSPCPKIAPNSNAPNGNYIELNIQLYGGGLWNSWFDRDLAVAGRVIYEENGLLESKLVHITRPIVNIPELAIHLTTNRDSFEYNKETHVKPIIATTTYDAQQVTSVKTTNHYRGLLEAVSREAEIAPESIRDMELCMLDANPSRLTGLYEEFISSARLDNLMSTFCGLQAIKATEVKGRDIRLWCAFDNEEIGSTSQMGADSIMLETTLHRIFSTLPNFAGQPPDSLDACLRKSFLVSADMAHALHPNYPEKHQPFHAPKMHGGVVIKTNASQRYATDTVGASLIRSLAKWNDIPTQEFIVKNDSPCGSTIGPILASKTGIRVVDIGAPQLAMHSAREFMGIDDAWYYKRFMEVFFNDDAEVYCPASLQ